MPCYEIRIVAKWIWLALVRAHRSLRAARHRRSSHGIFKYLQSHCDGHAGALGMVPHASDRIPAVAGGTARCCRDLLCFDAVRRTKLALATPSRLDLCARHALQQLRTHPGHNPWAHTCVHPSRASRAGVLFVTLAVRWIDVDDQPVAAHQPNKSTEFATRHVAPDHRSGGRGTLELSPIPLRHGLGIALS